jgi:Protein of unknown function (DUF4239)
MIGRGVIRTRYRRGGELVVTPLSISIVTFALVFSGALVGMRLRRALSEDNLREEVRDVIKLSTGLIGTMAALVLGLLIASAKNTYDTKSAQIRQITADIILIDLDLERYGPEAQDLRVMLRDAILPMIAQIWNEGERAKLSAYSATVEAKELLKRFQQLQPDNDSKRAIHEQVLSAAANLSQARLSLFTESNDGIPTPFLAILILWLAIIFTSFGLLVRPDHAGHSRIVIVTFFVGALSVASSIFLILEMGRPFAGLMQISSEAPRHALAPLSQ